MTAKDYQDTEPRFVLEEYFKGNTRAWGIFQDRTGKIRRQFVVDIYGAWEGDEFVMREDFTYRDGETQQRVWRIKKVDAHRYSGRADDVVGEAFGEAYGQALNWRYTLRLPVEGRTWNVNFDDWMFLQDDGVLINKAVMRKFGIRLGEVTLVFQRRENAARRKAAA